MVLKRTPKNTQTATHEPQGPQHLPEENHPRRWIFIFRNMITPIDVSEQLHAELLMSENPQGNQILLEEEANRRLNRKGQDAFSIIGSKNAPLQGGAGGTTSTPVHGGVAKATSTPVHGEDGGTSSTPAHGEDVGTTSTPAHGEDGGTTSTPVHGEDDGTTSTPAHGEDGGTTSTPAHGGVGGANSNPAHGGVDRAHGRTGDGENHQPNQLHALSEDEDDAETQALLTNLCAETTAVEERWEQAIAKAQIFVDTFQQSTSGTSGGPIQNGRQERICVICASRLDEQFEHGTVQAVECVPYTMECGHVYHTKCIRQWCQQRNREGHLLTCPVCRNISAEENLQEPSDTSRGNLAWNAADNSMNGRASTPPVQQENNNSGSSGEGRPPGPGEGHSRRGSGPPILVFPASEEGELQGSQPPMDLDPQLFMNFLHFQNQQNFQSAMVLKDAVHDLSQRVQHITGLLRQNQHDLANTVQEIAAARQNQELENSCLRLHCDRILRAIISMQRPPSPYNVATTSTTIARNTPKPSNQNQARTQDGKCVFCKSKPHKYQLFCPKLKVMTPDVIWKIAQKKGISCRMCLGLGHVTKNCEASKNGELIKCSIENQNGELCNGWHCRFLHWNFKKESTPLQDKKSRK